MKTAECGGGLSADDDGDGPSDAELAGEKKKDDATPKKAAKKKAEARPKKGFKKNESGGGPCLVWYEADEKNKAFLMYYRKLNCKTFKWNGATGRKKAQKLAKDTRAHGCDWEPYFLTRNTSTVFIELSVAS